MLLCSAAGAGAEAGVSNGSNEGLRDVWRVACGTVWRVAQ
jgi:hypothetical protein